MPLTDCVYVLVVRRRKAAQSVGERTPKSPPISGTHSITLPPAACYHGNNTGQKAGENKGKGSERVIFTWLCDKNLLY